MRKFNGHFYPGLYLFCYGLYQATVTFTTMRTNGPLLCPSCLLRPQGRWSRLRKLSYGGWLKLVTGAILAVYVVFCLDGGMVLMSDEKLPRFMFPQEWQHFTMFVLLALNGCVDIASRDVLPRRCVVLEQAALILNFCILLMLLVAHNQASTGVELQVHGLLILVVLLLTLVLTAELWAPATICLALIQTLLFLLMGSWLMQAGFILFRPVTGYPWRDDDVSDVMFVTTFFCWHIMVDALCLLAIYGLSSVCHRACGPCPELMRPKDAQATPALGVEGSIICCGKWCRQTERTRLSWQTAALDAEAEAEAGL